MRATSYVYAIAAAASMLAGIWWAASSEPKVEPTTVKAAGGQRFAATAVATKEPLQACVVCHRVTADGPERSAPALWGIVDAPKASAAWFGYSAALAKAGGTWTAAELDRYLTNPTAALPGTAKTLSPIRDANTRKAVVTALQTLKR